MKLEQKIVLCNIRRTPFAQIGKSLGEYPAHILGKLVVEDIVKQAKLDKTKVDGIIVGEGFPQAPNPARVIAGLLDFPVDMPALTVANNCVSSLEAVAEAARRIALGEGELFIAVGEESQTHIPFSIKNARQNKKTATLDKLKSLLPENLPEGVELRDSLEDGLGDGETSFGMHVTAEILAQNYELTRELSDEFAYQSYKRAYDSTKEGKYNDHIIPLKDDEGNDMSGDEAVLLRKGIVENPGRMERAMLLFENPQMKFDDFKKKYAKFLQKTHGPTVTIFNACPRSDGASGLIVTTMAKAKELGLKVEAVLTGWKMKGVHPNYMGLGQAEASLGLLEDLNLSMKDVDQVEIHEAFAATAVSALEEIKKRTGFEWKSAFDAKKINENGGSIAIGHPFGATGIRLISNAVMDFRLHDDTNRVLVTACAHGGVAGALMLERP